MLYNSFNEFERLDYVNWAMFLKDDVVDKVTKMDAAAEGEVGSWLKVEDSNRDLPLSLSSVKEDGCFFVFISRHLSESLNDNIYSFIGEAYGTMEIVRIKGTITISE